ncbi:MAG TPA: hypothetical protein VGH28_26085 [Polyangiaceae bacterium]|jgi:hypothetical protein
MPAAGISLRGPHAYLARALALTRRAEALGARVVAWSGSTIAFAWEPDAMEEVILLATGLRDETAPPEAQWACGIAQGELEPLGRGDLAWGEPLLRAVSLAHVAQPGEVLLDGRVGSLARGELATSGVRSASDQQRPASGVKLDLRTPWLRAPGSPAPAESGEAPEEFAARMVELGRRALVSGNTRALQHSSEALRATGEHDTLADRMRALARLSRGQIDEAIRALRQSRALATSEPPAVQCQAALALALAQQTAGHPDEALLEGLDALARAREAGDSRAQAACLAFLAKLFARVGAAVGAKKIGAQLAALGRRPSLSDVALDDPLAKPR